MIKTMCCHDGGVNLWYSTRDEMRTSFIGHAIGKPFDAIQIHYCPFCGKKLKAFKGEIEGTYEDSLRMVWSSPSDSERVSARETVVMVRWLMVFLTMVVICCCVAWMKNTNERIEKVKQKAQQNQPQPNDIPGEG